MLANHKTKIIILALGLLIVFAFLSISSLMLGQSDVYPHYSCLRSDQTGCMGIYKSLDGLESVRVERNITPLDYYEIPEQSTLVFMNLSDQNISEFSYEQKEQFENFVRSGGHLVFMMSAKLMPAMRHLPFDVSLKDGIKLETNIESTDKNIDFKDYKWQNQAHFTNFDKEKWDTLIKLKTKKDKAVLIRREMGDGQITYCSDGQFMLNYALRHKANSKLISLALDEADHVIFNETHLGVVESQTLMTIVDQLNLKILIFFFILIGLLYIWKNSFSLTPAITEEDESKHLQKIEGKNSHSAFVHLLRKHIHSKQLLETCFDEWSKLNKDSVNKDDYKRIKGIVRDEEFKENKSLCIEAYRKICQILDKKRKG